jgi:hypothetical protein
MESSQKDSTRKDMAVLCSLAELPDGGLRIVLDDVRKSHESGAWVYHSLFTYKDYASLNLDDLAALSETELADFGYHVLARLIASSIVG